MADGEHFVLKRRYGFSLSRRWDFHARDFTGKPGPLVVRAREDADYEELFTFFGDTECSDQLFRFHPLEGSTEYAITGADGTLIGRFERDEKASEDRSTWKLSTADGLVAVGRERSTEIASLRRLCKMFGLPQPRCHFDFKTPDRSLVLSSDRTWAVLDTYRITLPVLPDGSRLDWRVGAAMAVALDVLESL